MGITVRRIRLGLTLTLALSTVGLSPPSSAAAGPSGMACPREGVVSITPGLTTSDRDFSVVDLGTYGPCQMPDGSVLSGKLTAEGTGHGSCSNGTAAGRIHIAWSNGAVTTGRFDVVYHSPVALVVYPVTEGAFAGTNRSRSVLFLTPAEPGLCFSTGIAQSAYQGVITFRP